MASLLSGAATFVLRVAIDLAMKQHAPAFNSVLDAVLRVLVDMVIGVLIDTVVDVLRYIALWASSLVAVVFELADWTMARYALFDAATFTLRVVISRAMKQHVPAFFLHGPAAAPTRNRVLDAAVRFLLDTAVVVLQVALWAVFLVGVLAVLLLLLVLFTSCVVAALAAIVVYLDPARGFSNRERHLTLLAFISLFLVTVAVLVMVVAILATVEEVMRSEDIESREGTTKVTT